MQYWYKLITYLFYPFVPIYLFLRKLNNKEHPTRYKEKMSQTNFSRDKGFLVWFHVASVGEGMSILPLLESLEKEEKIKAVAQGIRNREFSPITGRHCEWCDYKNFICPAWEDNSN